MDLSKVKWLVIGVIVIGLIFLVTNPGINWVYARATSGPVGESESTDSAKEATLSRYGGFLLATFRYEKSRKFYTAAINRYPAGDNRYWNRYQLARVHEKLENWQEAAELLYYLWEVDADQYDERVPGQDILKARILTLVEVHDLPDPFDTVNARR